MSEVDLDRDPSASSFGSDQSTNSYNKTCLVKVTIPLENTCNSLTFVITMNERNRNLIRKIVAGTKLSSVEMNFERSQLHPVRHLRLWGNAHLQTETLTLTWEQKNGRREESR